MKCCIIVMATFGCNVPFPVLSDRVTRPFLEGEARVDGKVCMPIVMEHWEDEVNRSLVERTWRASQSQLARSRQNTWY